MAIAVIIALISWPIIEIALLIKLGSAIGILPLLMLLVGMAVAGGLVLRQQGLAVARRAMEQMSRHEPPVQSMVDGIGLSIAGFLFLVPGLISDVAGLLLLVPQLRRPLVARLFGLASDRFDTFGPGRRERADDRSGPHGSADGRGPDRGPVRDGMVIEGEFERIEERTVRPGRGPQGPSAGPQGGSPPDDSPWRG